MRYKYIILILCLFFVIGCRDKNVENITKEEISIGKINDELGYVLVEQYQTYNLSNGETYVAEILSINLESVELSNLNMTMKNNIYLNTKEFKYNDFNYVTSGNLVKYKYYEGSDYISIIESTTNYFDDIYGSVVDKVFVINKSTGKILNNIDLLNLFKLDDNVIYDMVKQSGVEDSDYVVMYIKNNGYLLYINENGDLVLMYDYISDDNELKKELILVD